MSTYLTTSVFDTDIYATSYGKRLTAYAQPVCPATFNGATQVYNVDNGVCTTVQPAAAMAPGKTAAGCGGAPFQVQVDGKCYSTNDCPVSSSLSDTCLNAQNVPVREQTMYGPGVLYNSVYAGGRA